MKQVYNVKKKICLQIICVDHELNVNNNEVINITSLLNTKIIIEKPHNTDMVFCNVSIGKSVVRKTPAIIIFAALNASNLSKEYIKDRNNPAKCALCFNNNNANFRGS